MESTGLPMAIQLSEATYSMLPEESQAECVLRGTIEVKGKGLMSTYLVQPAPELLQQLQAEGGGAAAGRAVVGPPPPSSACLPAFGSAAHSPFLGTDSHPDNL